MLLSPPKQDQRLGWGNWPPLLLPQPRQPWEDPACVTEQQRRFPARDRVCADGEGVSWRLRAVSVSAAVTERQEVASLHSGAGRRLAWPRATSPDFTGPTPCPALSPQRAAVQAATLKDLEVSFCSPLCAQVNLGGQLSHPLLSRGHSQPHPFLRIRKIFSRSWDGLVLVTVTDCQPPPTIPSQGHSR